MTFFDTLDKQAYDAERSALFEEKVIKQLLKFGGCRYSAKQLERDARSKDFSRITWEWFYSTFPNFPVIVGCDNLPCIYSIPFHEFLVKDFSKSTLIKLVNSFIVENEVDPSDEAFMFVFRSINTYVCCHNLKLIEDLDIPYVFIPVKSKGERLSYYMNRLEHVMQLFQKNAEDYFEL